MDYIRIFLPAVKIVEAQKPSSKTLTIVDFCAIHQQEINQVDYITSFHRLQVFVLRI